jgi:WD40 repeat protein
MKSLTVMVVILLALFIPAAAQEVDLLFQAQDARWQNGDGIILRFGQDSKSLGAALFESNVVLEDGKTYEKILFTHPQWKRNGELKGFFPVITVPEQGGKLFLTAGFRQGATGTDGVTFIAQFIDQRPDNRGVRVRGDMPTRSLGSFRALYNGRLESTEIDLAPVAGRMGMIVLGVLAGNTADNDWAVWTEARLVLGQTVVKEEESVRKKRMIQTMSGHSNRIYRALFSPDGRFIVTASGDGTAKIWDGKNGRLQSTLSGHGSHVFCASFSPNSRQAVTAGDNVAIVWDVRSGHRVQTLQGHAMRVHSAYFNSGGSRIITTSEDGTAKIWNAASGEEQISVQVVPKGWAYSAQFNPTGGSFAAGGHNGGLGIWDAGNGRQVATLQGHNRAINMVSYSPNGRYLLTASVDDTVKIWDLSRNREGETLRGRQFNSAIFNADGRYIITGNNNGKATIWDAGSGKLVLTLDHGGDRVFCADISPDGKYAVTAGDNNIAKLWEINL